MPVDYQNLVLPCIAGEPAPRVAHGVPSSSWRRPVGSALAIDLARYGTPVAVARRRRPAVDGSAGIVSRKRTLEIWDRLGCGEPIASKARVVERRQSVFPRPARLRIRPAAPKRGTAGRRSSICSSTTSKDCCTNTHVSNPTSKCASDRKVVAVEQSAGGASVGVETPDGRYDLACDYAIACDGARLAGARDAGSPDARADVSRPLPDRRRQDGADLPIERRFWFDPPFHRHGPAPMHRQADNVWRIDFQLGFDADPVVEREPARVMARVRAMLGDDTNVELVWWSVYTFSCMRMERFRHGRVIFAGDCAHGVSPFGARGANSGVQDADNLAWKLHYVIRGDAPDQLLDTYASERERAADENIAHSTRSADFLTPKTDMSRVFRDAVLSLAQAHPFARRLVNSGRLSTATTLVDSPLATPDRDRFDGLMAPGTAAADAPVTVAGRRDWFCTRSAAACRRPFLRARDSATTLSGLAESLMATRCASIRCRRRRRRMLPATTTRSSTPSACSPHARCGRRHDISVSTRSARAHAGAASTPAPCARRLEPPATADPMPLNVEPNSRRPTRSTKRCSTRTAAWISRRASASTPGWCCCSPTISATSTCCATRSSVRGTATVIRQPEHSIDIPTTLERES
jgi:3-(3-hydroxy-phenyl)propionate hydroxylase